MLGLARLAAAELRQDGSDVRAGQLLRRAAGTPDQGGLRGVQRRSNLAGALRVRGGSDGRPVIIVDDILTTGASVAAAWEALDRAGIAVEGAAVLATAPVPRTGHGQTTTFGY
ncbi:hypothetical protein GCM10027589_49440 [Actinocorallia lasiicapitis]